MMPKSLKPGKKIVKKNGVPISNQSRGDLAAVESMGSSAPPAKFAKKMIQSGRIREKPTQEGAYHHASRAQEKSMAAPMVEAAHSAKKLMKEHGALSYSPLATKKTRR